MREGHYDELIEAVCRLIAERGAYGVSFGDVSREAGVSKGTLSYYFSSKDGLVEAAAEQSIKRLSSALLAWVDSVAPEAAPEAPLDALCDAMLADGTPLRVFISVNGVVSSGSELEAALDRALGEWSVMIDVGSMRMRPEVSARMKRLSSAVIPFLCGLAALNADIAYAKEAFTALVLG